MDTNRTERRASQALRQVSRRRSRSHLRGIQASQRVTGQVLGSVKCDQAAAGIQGWPSVSIIRASKKLSPCLAAVEQVAADRAELPGAGECPQGPGYFLSQLDHPNVAFGSVIVRWYPPVAGESQIIVLAVDQAPGQGVVLFSSACRSARRSGWPRAGPRSGSCGSARPARLGPQCRGLAVPREVRDQAEPSRAAAPAGVLDPAAREPTIPGAGKRARQQPKAVAQRTPLRTRPTHSP